MTFVARLLLLLLLKFHVCETKWANIEQLTVFICFAIEQEFSVVVIVVITQSAAEDRER